MAARKRLHQDRIWIDADGRVHAIDRMGRRHAANAILYLERRARRLHDGECAESSFWPEPRGEQASYAVEDEREWLLTADPLDWLRATPLMRALITRADGHPGGPSRRWKLRHPGAAIRQALRRRALA